MTIGRTVAATLFVIAVVVALLLTNVRIAATQPAIYEYSFSQYDAVETTGVARSELDRAAREIVEYFGSGHVPDLIIAVTIAGQSQSLFNEREILHMRDVRELFRGAFRVQELALIYIVGYVGIVAFRRRRRALDHVARLALSAGALTVGLIGATGVAVLIGFHWLFTQFHLLSFSNDFWRLDPRTDRLIQMFPDGFWFDVTIGVAVITLVEGLLIVGGAYLLLRRYTDFEAGKLVRWPRAMLLGR